MNSLQLEIKALIARGYQVRSETERSAHLIRPKKLSLAWLLLSIVSLVGWIPYVGYHLFLKRVKSVYLTVGDDGKVTVNRHSR